MSDPYVGEIRMFSGTFAPQGWAMCDGALMSISVSEVLFTLLGTTYGGDGVTTFAVPDLRGRAPFHRSTNYPQGASGGMETVTLTQVQLASHTHPANAKKGNGASSAPAAHYWAGNSDIPFYGETEPNVPFANTAISAAGGNLPHENMMPFTTVSFIIALEGIYPNPD